MKEKKGNDEEYIGGEEEYAIDTSSGNRGRGSGSSSNSDKVDSKRSQEIAKYIRGKGFSDRKNVLKKNSGGQTLQVQG